MKSAEMTLVRLDSADILTASGGGGPVGNWARVTGVGGSRGDARVEGSLFGKSFDYSGDDVFSFFRELFGDDFIESLPDGQICFVNGNGGMYLIEPFTEDYDENFPVNDTSFNGDYLWDEIDRMFKIRQ